MEPGVYPKRLFFSKYPATTGNRVALLQDGDESYPAMLAAIRAALRNVHLEVYIFESDLVGWRFARALAEKAREGVSVRVVLDFVGCLRLSSELVLYLRGAGVRLFFYNPMRWRQLAALARRDHRKILTVDGRVGFVGGLNVSATHIAAPLGGGWHDALVELEGPVVASLDALFLRQFNRFLPKRERLPVPETPSRDPLGRRGGWCRVLSNQELTQRYVIRRQYLRQIRRAKRSILIASGYFLPDAHVRAALRAAARRGVEISLLLPGTSDVPLVKQAQQAFYSRYLRWRFGVYEWRGPMLHHKVACFDEAVLSVGSYNLDNRSLVHNLEVSVWISRSVAVTQAISALRKDLEAARHVALGEWQERGWWRRLVELLAFLIHRRL